MNTNNRIKYKIIRIPKYMTYELNDAREIIRYNYIDNQIKHNKNFIDLLFNNNDLTNRDVLIPELKEFNKILHILENESETLLNKQFITKFKQNLLKKMNLNLKIDNNNRLFWGYVRSYQMKLLSPISYSVPPDFKNQINKKFETNYEIFGLFFNSMFKYHNSIFPDLHLHGSITNFYNWEPIGGSYYGSPPYSEKIMTVMYNKLLDSLHKSEMKKIKLQFILMLPIWDKESRNKINAKPYPDFPPQTKAVKSKYNKYMYLIPKSKIRVFNYMINKYINNIGDTSIMILQNYDLNDSEIQFMNQLINKTLIINEIHGK